MFQAKRNDFWQKLGKTRKISDKRRFGKLRNGFPEDGESGFPSLTGENWPECIAEDPFFFFLIDSNSGNNGGRTKGFLLDSFLEIDLALVGEKKLSASPQSGTFNSSRAIIFFVGGAYSYVVSICLLPRSTRI